MLGWRHVWPRPPLFGSSWCSGFPGAADAEFSAKLERGANRPAAGRTLQSNGKTAGRLWLRGVPVRSPTDPDSAAGIVDDQPGEGSPTGVISDDRRDP